MYADQKIIPTLRGMFYTLVSLNILENTSNRYDYLSKFTARAREKSEKHGEDRINRKGEEYYYEYKEEEMLPIDCFADNVRQIIDIDDIYETQPSSMTEERSIMSKILPRITKSRDGITRNTMSKYG